MGILRNRCNGQFAYPWVIAVDSSDNVYVADQMNHRVQKVLTAAAYSLPNGVLKESVMEISIGLVELK